MDLGIAGRRAVVAAGSAGLGFATAAALVDEGVRVAICGRDEGRLDAAVAQLGPGSVGVVADLSDPDQAGEFVTRATDLLGGPPDIAIANAGGPPPGPATTTGLDDFRHALELNFLATVALCQAVVADMTAQRWGRIVAITSIGARQPIPFLAASTSARAATTAFVKNLATEVAGDGVCANTLQPGSHETDRIRNLGGDQYRQLAADIPAGRLGDAADFGRVAAFLCSEPANFICGASLIVDGGATRGLQ